MALVLGLAPTGFAQPGGGGGAFGPAGMMFQDFGTAGAESAKAARVAVRLTADDGRMVKGHLRLTSVVIGSSLGVYEIRPEKVREVRLAAKADDGAAQVIVGGGGAQKAGSIVTVGGEVIEGVVLIPHWWRIETELGQLRPNPQALTSISFFREEGPPERLEPVPGRDIPPAPGAGVPKPAEAPAPPKPDSPPPSEARRSS